MENIRPGGRLMPLRATTFSNCWTRAGFDCWSGSNLLKSGSMRIGERKTPKRTAAMAGTQNQSHQRVGDLRIAQKSSRTSMLPTIQMRRKLLVWSQSQLGQCCTESP